MTNTYEGTFGKYYRKNERPHCCDSVNSKCLTFDTERSAFSITSILGLQLFLENLTGFSLRIVVAGERCNVTGAYFERGPMSEEKNSHRLPNICRRILRS